MSSRALSRFVSPAALSAACALVWGMSHAASLEPATVSVRVNSTGLDLSSDSGAQAMLRRIAVVVKQACGADAEFDPLRREQFWMCYHRAVSNSVRAMNQPMVTHVYIAQYPREAARYGIVDARYVAGR